MRKFLLANVIPIGAPKDPRIAVEAKQELDDAVDSLAEAAKLFEMAGKTEAARCAVRHMNAIRTLRRMS
jgi:hypothetical protein